MAADNEISSCFCFTTLFAPQSICKGIEMPRFGLPRESGVIEHQNVDNELLRLCCLFVITRVSDQNTKMNM